MAKKTRWNLPLLGFRTHRWWKEMIASIYYGIVLIFLLVSIIKYDGTDVSKGMSVFFSILMLIPIVIGIVKRPKGKKSAGSSAIEEAKPIEEPRESVRANRVVKHKSLHNADLKLHPDLEGLIWFSDGAMKNCPDSLEFDPSAIQTSLPIVVPTSVNDVSPLGYYPSYSGMSDFQRGVYIRYLSDPYQKIDIGYVFVLYYGLERYLLSANYKRAFDVILKLRDVHKNASFQSYSATALIYTAILHDRKDLLKVFIQSIDTEHEKQIPFDIFVLSKKAFFNGIYPEELIKYASSFGFTNKRYMVANYSSFVSHLSNVLIEKFGTAAYPTESLQIAELPTVETRAFANYTLKQTISIADISYAHQFIEEGAAMLQEAHNRVKCELRTAKTRQTE